LDLRAEASKIEAVMCGAMHLFHARHVHSVSLRCCSHRLLLLLDLRVELSDYVFDHFLLVLSNLRWGEINVSDDIQSHNAGARPRLLAGALDVVDFFNDSDLLKL